MADKKRFQLLLGRVLRKVIGIPYRYSVYIRILKNSETLQNGDLQKIQRAEMNGLRSANGCNTMGRQREIKIS